MYFSVNIIEIKDC